MVMYSTYNLIDLHMIDQRALFYRSIGIWLINRLCLTTSFVATQSSIHPSIRNKSWTWLDSCDSQIFPIEKDLFSTLGRNDFILRAKRLQTPGESNLGPGETTPGEQDIGWNDLLPPKQVVQVTFIASRHYWGELCNFEAFQIGLCYSFPIQYYVSLTHESVDTWLTIACCWSSVDHVSVDMLT